MAFMYVGTAAQEVDGNTMAVEDVVRLGGGKPDDWGVPNSESYKAANTPLNGEDETKPVRGRPDIPVNSKLADLVVDALAGDKPVRPRLQGARYPGRAPAGRSSSHISKNTEVTVTSVVGAKESAAAKKEAAAAKKREAEERKAAEKAAKILAAKEKRVADAEARFRKAQQELRRVIGSPEPEVELEVRTPAPKAPAGPKGSAKRSTPAPASGRPEKRTRSTP
ncbi:hypothetical protein EV126DRAFT_494708 [Verticillium dahliae]|nr:hypothetical protein EV126DRAFT_494708 [Verticillium dahliae]